MVSREEEAFGVYDCSAFYTPRCVAAPARGMAMRPDVRSSTPSPIPVMQYLCCACAFPMLRGIRLRGCNAVRALLYYFAFGRCVAAPDMA